TVEELVHPDVQPDLDNDIMLRYKTEWVNKNAIEGQQEEWVFRMINTKRPLEEKIALFWHGILCTGHAKCENPRQQNLELDMFRRDGMGRFSDLLLGLAVDPAMVFFLDNCMSHKGAINENWGRELLELFSLGVGMDGHLNYSEDDVKEAARAFTGWTVVNAIPRYPYGRYLSKFVYDPKDHDNGEKTLLGDIGKNARFASGKSPVQTVVCTARMVGEFTFPQPGFNGLTLSIRYMGQDILNPPTVEGWHTGKEWIDSGTLVERINFTADKVGNVNLPGVRDIIGRLRADGRTLST